ncbi:unnamed protein product [Gongylonema pulchrum]|uniref:Uncharacterized protein n=1 Tax=Gongylonema pulchrum TaxID=637853 RepID=A0A183ECC1_9BILA|nr:unnamed protein product [Gongylonema pulchrum]
MKLGYPSFFQLRRELGRLMCDSSAKTVAPKRRVRKLSSKKLFKYAINNESTGNSASSSQRDDYGRCDVSTTQGGGHDVFATRSSDIYNGVSTNTASAPGATMTVGAATTTSTSKATVTAAEKPQYRRLLVDNGVVIIVKNDASDV